ncbi:hypothetical protein [Nocardia aurea]|uniref:hypothetical protein n=1 Tax=Nocardia aurea TaxID=2144174 RepID=UPI003F4D0A0C
MRSASERFGFDSAQAGFAIAAAKSCAGHGASAVARNAHQCLDAIGFTAEHEPHRHTNRLLAWRSEFGSVHYWDNMLLHSGVDAESRGLWPMIADRLCDPEMSAPVPKSAPAGSSTGYLAWRKTGRAGI